MFELLLSPDTLSIFSPLDILSSVLDAAISLSFPPLLLPNGKTNVGFLRDVKIKRLIFSYDVFFFIKAFLRLF